MVSARDAYRLQTLARRGKVEITEEGIKLLEKLTKSLNSANTTNGGCPIAESPVKENISTPHNGKSNTSKKRKRVAAPSPERVKQPNCALKDIVHFYPALSSSSRTSSKGTTHNSVGYEHSQSGITVGTSSSMHIPPFHTEQPITSVKQPTSLKFLDAFECGEEWLPGLLKPTNLENFIRENYGKSPLHVKRGDRSKYKSDIWLTSSELFEIMLEEPLLYGEHVDLLDSGTQSSQETMYPRGERAVSEVVFNHYAGNGGIRFSNPQTYVQRIFPLLNTLQENFGCRCYATAYLFPSEFTGFTVNRSHVDVFILQQEGKQKVQVSRSTEGEMAGENKDILTFAMNPGDLLYIPKGSQFSMAPNSSKHSLHICISLDEKYTWADYLTELFPIIIKSAAENDADFNQSLPIKCFKDIGSLYTMSDGNREMVEREQEFRQRTVELLKRLVNKIECREILTVSTSENREFGNKNNNSQSRQQNFQLKTTSLPNCGD
ncbi:unnamed protein product [Trichobilharzia szidati]|nr:unnamed protein product [Trichobilharzia szidati]